MRAFEDRAGGVAPVRVVAWELTRACNLACPYCRASAGAAHGAMPLDDALKTLDEIRELGNPLLILSGGEPLLADSWRDVAERARALSLPVALATNGTLIDAAAAQAIRECGIGRVSVSLDRADAAGHDAVRGEGSFNAAMKGIRLLHEAGVSFQINLTVGRDNASAAGGVLDLTVALGADALHLFFVVDVGRAAGRRLGLDARAYERALEEVARLERESPIEIRVTCAPQYERIRKAAGVVDRKGRRASRGCMAGRGFLFISATGEVKPCGYFDLVLGHIGEKPLAGLWADHPVLAAMRDPDRLKGSCGVCSERHLCGGCRARALAATGDFLECDPACTYNNQ